jgi:hypothetical protein
VHEYVPTDVRPPEREPAAEVIRDRRERAEDHPLARLPDHGAPRHRLAADPRLHVRLKSIEHRRDETGSGDDEPEAARVLVHVRRNG